MARVKCQACGMEREQWSDPEGFLNHGKVYCCSGCAEGKECLCPEPVPGEPVEEQEAQRLDAALQQREELMERPEASDDEAEEDELPADKQVTYRDQPDRPLD